ncbi:MULTISPECIES: GGDEF domain-containing protein [unclassified Comamonas]|uniref:GGDEF domain-containing protein n=1 Tax=unclassified Comamonas TaxID=2638500 RepID=UPI0017816FDD|nr:MULTISPECIES: GGDEF domain-containing protein [unclassified Comamonas]MBD9402692.1 GGDEF domain-containing protein [Comamonas sp. CMM02]
MALNHRFVTGTNFLSLTAFQQLRLDGALALLGEEESVALPHAQIDAVARLQAIIDGLCDLSLRDPLTGTANRRHFDSVLDRELDRVARSGDVALLLMIDIDHFKQVNDQYGHNVGDAVLQQVAHALTGCVRPMDTLARYGGEEFAIVLPACQPAYGQNVADRVRRAVEALHIRIASGHEIKVTVSIGGAYALQWIRSTRKLWVERADQQLYVAKGAGRNRIEIEQQPDSTVTAEEKNLLFIPELSADTSTWSGDWIEVLAASTDSADGVN